MLQHQTRTNVGSSGMSLFEHQLFTYLQNGGREDTDHGQVFSGHLRISTPIAYIRAAAYSK